MDLQTGNLGLVRLLQELYMSGGFGLPRPEFREASVFAAPLIEPHRLDGAGQLSKMGMRQVPSLKRCTSTGCGNFQALTTY